MWTRCLSWWMLGMLVGTPVRAGMQEWALQARALLGPGVWSQVLRIENSRAGSAPLAAVYALVFELEDRLWYYASDSGTQSLSVYRDRLEFDKLNLGDLLRQIEPRYRRYTPVETPESAPARPPDGGLPNGCFIECVAYLRTMIDAGDPPDDARMVAYYGTQTGGTPGHTVLYFSRGARRFCYDPERAAAPQLLPANVPVEPLAIALATAPGRGYASPQRAVFLPLHGWAPRPAPWTEQMLVAGMPAADGADAPVLGK